MSARPDKELAHSLRDLMTRLNRKLRKQISNPEQLSVAELNVLVLLITDDLLPSELCAQLNLSSQYMSQVLNRLESMDYILRKPCLKDRRKSFASLNGKGKQIIKESRQEKEEWLAALIAANYNQQDKETIRRAIDLLAIIAGL